MDLPEDIYFAVCHELFLREDFHTLFSCAVSSKKLAPLACANLYRIYSLSTVGDEEAEAIQGTTQVQRWSIMWRSIILSAMGGTMLPYYKYLRFLNLRDLQNLIEDTKFRDNIEETFFSGKMSKLKKTRRGMRGRTWLDPKAIVNVAGDEVAPKAPMLEQLSGDISSAALLRWIPGLSRLQSLDLWDGTALGDSTVQDIIAQHCPHFKALSIFLWANPDSDQQLGNFISKLKPQTLESFTTISKCGVSVQTCLALDNHNASLKELRLTFEQSGIEGLKELDKITSLELLSLDLLESIELKASQRDIFDRACSWFGSCLNLREITLTEFHDGPELLLPLISNPDVHLEEIYLNARHHFYPMKDNIKFHEALVQQRESLQGLCLRGDAEEAEQYDNDILTNSVCELKHLRRLQLRGVSDNFDNDRIARVLRALPDLEEVYIGGNEVGDTVLQTAASLVGLRAITFNAGTHFTLKGLLEFVSKLRPSNEGLILAIDNAHPMSLLPEEKLDLVRNSLREKVQGRLDYVPMQDPDISEFEGESD